MSNFTIVEAEAILADARNRAAADVRANDLELLQAMRNDLRTAQAEYERLSLEVATVESQRVDSAKRIAAARYLVDRSKERMLSCADLLPMDPDVVAWRSQHAKFEAALAEQLAELRALPVADRMLALQYFNAVNSLNLRISNLTAKLRGDFKSTGGEIFSGGVYTVA